MKYNIIIIGAGPAGYIAAIRAGQLGMKVLLADREKLGGMCINWGCIPAKSLLESVRLYSKVNELADFGIEGIKPSDMAFNWSKAVSRANSNAASLRSGIEFLLHKNGVEFEQGEVVITGKNTVSINNRLLEADNIIIATGSLPAPSESENTMGIRALYKMENLPSEIVVEGNGPVAVEIAQMLNMTGVKVYLNTHANPLVPGADDFINQYLLKTLRNQGVIINSEKKIDKNILRLNANMRIAIVPENIIGLELDEKGFIAVDEHLETNVKGIYAVGDVNGKSYLAHAASAQGLFAVNHISGLKGEMRHDRYPMNIYTLPEIAQIGKTEQDLNNAGIEYRLSSFPLSANAKALIKGESEGVVRILSEIKYGEVLGVQIIAENATDMIAEAAAFIEMEASVFDVARTVHAHPTISEVFSEAGFVAIDEAMRK